MCAGQVAAASTKVNQPGRLLQRVLAGLLAVSLHITPVRAARGELPPLIDPPSGEHHEGKVVWADLVTPDVEAAKRFYGGLFGWTFRDLEGGPKDYTLALLQGAPVAGLVRRSEPPGERHQPAWLTFLSASDVEKVRRTALSHGARELTPPRDYPRRGQQVVLADPQGAVFAILQSTAGDPPDVLAKPGEWVWSALLTPDAETNAAFYQALFDYEVFESEDEQGSEHLMLATDGFARASCNSFPHDSAKRDAHWLNYVRVANVAETAAKARQLGGRVLVEPHSDRGAGPIAVIADPAGAPIGLLEWSDTQEQDEHGAAE